VRLQFANHLGPAREIHAGSGYWSQDSATQVVTTKLNKESATGIQVRWPGGKVVEAKFPSDAREISIDTNGKIETLR
jgi:enediyne biosynthesis protein E4